MKTEAENLRKRLDKAKRLEKSWDLLRLCRQMIEEEGSKWERNKNIREEEIKRKERIGRALAKKKIFEEKENLKETQTKITDKLKELPRNRAILVEKEIEKERLKNLQEAKKEIWKKWRQKKGREKKITVGRIKELSLEDKMRKIEAEIERYRKEIEEEEERKRKKEVQIKKKKDKEKR